MTPCLSSRGVRKLWEGTHAVRSPFEEWHVSISYGNEQVWVRLGQEQATRTQNTFLDKNEACCKCVEQEVG